MVLLLALSLVSSLLFGISSASAQCAEPQIEESLLMSTSDLEMVTPDEALTRRAGEWRLSEHLEGGLSPTRYLRALTLDLWGVCQTPKNLLHCERGAG